jgi:exo-1,4-beta-D-glucosaminidase
LVESGEYKDIYLSDNLTKIDASRFDVPWWYRTEFQISNIDGIHQLLLNGVNYRANVFLNGKKIADSKYIETAFQQFKINVSPYLKQGNNALALELIPPKKDELTIGFVDWNPSPADKNLGIWREVILRRTDDVIIDGLFVETDVNTNTLKSADVSLYAWLENKGEAKSVDCFVEFEGVKLEKTISLEANEKRKITFNADEFKVLKIENPRLWWPNGLGKAELYHLKFTTKYNDVVSDQKNTRFGIRNVEQYLNTNGHKAYKINGKKIIIKGAGWVDDILLGDSDQKVKDQMAYVKHMNLNTVRLEGFWGRNSTIYDSADELGLLLMIGWSCHWEWEGYCNRKESEFMCIYTPEDEDRHAKGFRDQVKWLRNHPSIFLWVYGSDKLPTPTLEKKLNDLVLQEDTSRPILGCCKGNDFGTDFWNVSKISGSTGVKMLGPYGYVTPNYWFEDTKIGGAFGFNTETGPGPQVPPIESIKRMIPADKLWPINEMWDFHSGRNEFQTLNRFIKAFNARYGESTSAEDFALYCQLSNYEAIRPMYEAFALNKFNSTGVIQWMLNSAWPELFWQLYDWYLLPNASFYGTQNACQPLNLIYNYADNSVNVTNEYFDAQVDLKAEIKVYDVNSKLLYDKSISISAQANASDKVLDIPAIKNLSELYFLDLRLIDASNKIIADNFYWLSTKKDVCDYKNSEWFITPNSEYANLKDIRTMPKVKIDTAFDIVEAGDFYEISATLDNPTDKLAFFIELSAINKQTGLTVVPVFWSDNYVSLLPGEKKVLTAKVRKKGLLKKDIDFKILGVNLEL